MSSFDCVLEFGLYLTFCMFGARTYATILLDLNPRFGAARGGGALQSPPLGFGDPAFDPLVFVLDASIKFDPDIVDKVRALVVKGKSTYAPIYYGNFSGEFNGLFVCPHFCTAL